MTHSASYPTPTGMPPKPADVSNRQHLFHIHAFKLMQTLDESKPRDDNRIIASRIKRLLYRTHCLERLDEILGTDWPNMHAIGIDDPARNVPSKHHSYWLFICHLLHIMRVS